MFFESFSLLLLKQKGDKSNVYLFIIMFIFQFSASLRLFIICNEKSVLNIKTAILEAFFGIITSRSHCSKHKFTLQAL